MPRNPGGTPRSKFGRGDWIRTSDPLRPRQVRYQAALRPDSEPLDPTALSNGTFIALPSNYRRESPNPFPHPTCRKTPAFVGANGRRRQSERFICSLPAGKGTTQPLEGGYEAVQRRTPQKCRVGKTAGFSDVVIGRRARSLKPPLCVLLRPQHIDRIDARRRARRGHEIPLATVDFDGVGLRVKMSAPPSAPAADLPCPVMAVVADHFEGEWDTPGAEHARLKLIRANESSGSIQGA